MTMLRFKALKDFTFITEGGAKINVPKDFEFSNTKTEEIKEHINKGNIICLDDKDEVKAPKKEKKNK